MKRGTFNFALDCLVALAALGLIGTGIVIRFALPPGSGRQRFLWGLSRHQWGDVHFWLAVAAVFILVVHVAIHWTWVVSIVASRRRGGELHLPSHSTRVVAGIAVLTVLTGLVLGFWQLSIRQVTNPEQRRGGLTPPVEQEGARIKGSMTLGEVSKATGLPLQIIKQRLKLPGQVRETDKLGQLSHKYGFTMEQARKWLAEPVETTTMPKATSGQE